MKKIDLLNVASDLRRIANWMARDQKEKLPLMIKLWNKARKEKEVSQLTKRLVGEVTPPKALRDSNLRTFFAEQTLLSSIILQNRFQ